MDQEKKNKNVKLDIVIIILAIAILLMVVAFAFCFAKEKGLFDKNSSKSVNVSETTTQSQTQEETTGGKTSTQEEEKATTASEETTQTPEATTKGKSPQVDEKTRIKEAMKDPDGYIFPDSDNTYLKEEDLISLSKKQLSLARNEIYARLGREFSGEELKSYFEGKSWYDPWLSGEEFDALGDLAMNKYEIANKDLIVSIEEKKGYRK